MEHSPEVWHIPPGTLCTYIYIYIYIYSIYLCVCFQENYIYEPKETLLKEYEMNSLKPSSYITYHRV